METNQITRSNGRTFTLKDNVNRFFFPDEYLQFENVLKPKQKFSVKCMINTGARINELQNVKKEDIDFEHQRIVLRKTKAKAKKGEKVGKIRIIPISKQFTKYLKKELANLKLDDKLPMLKNSSLNIAYKIAGKKINLKHPEDISSNTFRKTLETWLMSLGLQDLALLAHFGHDFKTASRHYVSPDIFNWDEKKRMRIVIGDLYGR